MILLTEDQLNGLFNQLRGSCLKAYEQENEHASSDFVIAAILDTPNPPLPVSEDREVWVEVDSKEFAKEVEVGSELMHGVDFNDKIYWLKKVKLSSLVLNSSDNISVHDAMNHKADKNQSK